MFCSSCEKYLNIVDGRCSTCDKDECKYPQGSTFIGGHKIHYKEYAAKSVREKNKGTKIKQECPECKSEYLYYYTMQLRSADEGQTVFYECDCGYKSKENT